MAVKVKKFLSSEIITVIDHRAWPYITIISTTELNSLLMHEPLLAADL